ncbi:XdhC family protein [Neobacillus mesonae]|uniref:XdhC family protein n=1 Tax=Neobacillus mesonae TaxID=1193713 RepID=UPI00203C5FF1|nr:XdhC/CoxI family protein [Neobacillus mesonae]MCM3568464.1 XdhC family protein [Neobacillus mesonae]
MIITELKRCIQNNQKAVLAVIIDKKGSSYRQVGAKSLIQSDGTIVGVLSGGCIEQDLFEHAKDVFETGDPKQIVYDLRNDDDAPWGLGVGCNGVITIWLSLIDPVNRKKEAENMMNIFERQYSSTEPFTLGAVITSDRHEVLSPGTVFEPNEMDTTYLPFNKLNGIIESQSFLIDGKAVNAAIFLETITPTPSIIVFGAGPDASSLANQLKLLHWHVTVVDHRPGYVTEENFPNVDELKLVSPRRFPEGLELNENTYAVIMTHHYEQDLVYLKGLMKENPAYIGLLGPKRRFENLKKDLQVQGVTIPAFMEDRIHTPIGLDIGSETPEEIALSIAAEIMSCRNKASYQPLKWKTDSIHTAVSENQYCHMKLVEME